LSEGFAGLVVSAKGCERMENALIPIPIKEGFHAVGSGRDFALSAMRLGRTAREAIELACEFDVFTGGPITVLDLLPVTVPAVKMDNNVFWLAEDGVKVLRADLINATAKLMSRVC
jgi:hypothetical protein